jgi:ABC-type lipoprotein export system ATPase subunit
VGVLEITDLTKSYRSASETVAVLRGVNLRVGPRESVALSGESGSGKSTLLHLIAGSMRPTAARSRSTVSRSPGSTMRRAPTCGATGWGWCSSSST